jgi:hypothetical protein
VSINALADGLREAGRKAGTRVAGLVAPNSLTGSHGEPANHTVASRVTRREMYQ